MKQKMKQKATLSIVFRVLVLIALAAILIACAETTTGGGGGTTLPESIVGTIALEDGSSASFEFFLGALSGAGGPVSASATAPATGNARYLETDHSVSGAYDDTTNDLSPTATSLGGARLVFSGTYTADDGYVATVQYFDADGNLITEGAAYGTPVFSGETITGVYLGSYSGDQGSSGTWNGTVTATEFFGTYAESSFGESGSFTADRTGTTIDNFVDNGSATSTVVTGTISADGETISGVWSSEGESGTWVGSLVDDEGDLPPAGTGSDDVYLLNLIEQTFDNVDAIVFDIADTNGDGVLTTDDGLEPVGGTGGGGDVTFDNPVAGVDRAIYAVVPFDGEYFIVGARTDFNASGYTDPLTGLTFSDGSFFYQSIFDGDSNYIGMEIEIDRLLSADDFPGDDGGLTITFPDATSGDLYVDATIDDVNQSITGSWELDGVDAKATVEIWYF